MAEETIDLSFDDAMKAVEEAIATVRKTPNNTEERIVACYAWDNCAHQATMAAKTSKEFCILYKKTRRFMSSRIFYKKWHEAVAEESSVITTIADASELFENTEHDSDMGRPVVEKIVELTGIDIQRMHYMTRISVLKIIRTLNAPPQLCVHETIPELMDRHSIINRYASERSDNEEETAVIQKLATFFIKKTDAVPA